MQIIRRLGSGERWWAAEAVLRLFGACAARRYAPLAAAGFTARSTSRRRTRPTRPSFSPRSSPWLGWCLGSALSRRRTGLVQASSRARRGSGPSPSIARNTPMNDLIWLGVLAGLFLLTLAYLRLCDEA